MPLKKYSGDSFDAVTSFSNHPKFGSSLHVDRGSCDLQGAFSLEGEFYRILCQLTNQQGSVTVVVR